MAKVKHVFSFMTVIDFLAITPFYIEQSVKASGNEMGGAGTILTVLRIIRILRIFKLTQSNSTLEDLWGAFKIITHDLVIISVVLVTMMVLLATAIFFAEQKVVHPLRYEGEIWFDSIPDCLYWVAITLTTVGFGDVRPSSRVGRLIAGLASIASLLLINLPIAIIIMSFDEVYAIRTGREERARAVTNRLFRWVDRHKGKTNLMKHAMHRGSTINVARQRARRGSISLQIDSAIHGGGHDSIKNLSQPLDKQQRRNASEKARKLRKLAKTRMYDMILNPDLVTHGAVANSKFNGRQHYLATKYITIWEVRTQQGRVKRLAMAKIAISRLGAANRMKFPDAGTYYSMIDMIRSLRRVRRGIYYTLQDRYRLGGGGFGCVNWRLPVFCI